MILPTLEDVIFHEDSMEGWCTVCGDWTHDSCEPDAHNYTCPVCNDETVFGVDELVLQDMVK